MALKKIAERYKVNPWPWYPADECATSMLKKSVGRNYSKMVFVFGKGKIDMYGDENEWLLMADIILKKIVKDKNYPDEVEKNMLVGCRYISEFIELLKNIEVKKLSNEELWSIYSKHNALVKEMRIWGWIPVALELREDRLSSYLKKYLEKIIRSKNKESKITEIFSILTTPTDESFALKEEKDMLTIMLGIKNHGELMEPIKGGNFYGFKKKLKICPWISKMWNIHHKNYKWLTYMYEGPDMAEKEMFQLMQDIFRDYPHPEKRIIDIQKRADEISKRKIEIIKNFRIDDHYQYLFNVAARFMFLKVYRKDILMKSWSVMEKVMTEIAKRLKIRTQLAKYLMEDEIKKALIQNMVNRKLLAKRFEHSLLYTTNGKSRILVGEKMKLILNDVVEDYIDRDVKYIKGNPAYKGLAEGIVKKVAVTEDMVKMNKGDILVSPATNPDLIIAMRKAGAIVTDGGGITCHAAIVSRELKIPCIIGTKNATKILDDGDLVKVDSNKGIIRILKRYEKK